MKNIDILKYNEGIQVEKPHYNFWNYIDLRRWNSYYHQIEEVLILEPKTVLITGVGDNIIGTILSQQNVKVTTFDFDPTLNPDILGNIINIREVLQGKRFDVLLCCQVLEHLPYDNFEKIIEQFSNISDNVIISLPYAPIYFKVDIKIPYAKERRMIMNIHNGQIFKSNKEHYWEIGYRGYSRRKIQKSITKFFKIKKQFTAKHNHYHLFFILTKI